MLIYFKIKLKRENSENGFAGICLPSYRCLVKIRSEAFDTCPWEKVMRNPSNVTLSEQLIAANETSPLLHLLLVIKFNL